MDIDAIISMLKEEKEKLVSKQDFEMAVSLRDMERNLIEHRNISKFVKYVKGQSYYVDVQEFILPIDRKDRKSKLEKLEKLC